MTARQTRDQRINWLIDKLGLGIIGFFAVKTYGRLDDLTTMLNALYTQVQLHELTINMLKTLTR